MSIRLALVMVGFGLFSNSLCFAQELNVDVVAVRALISEWNAAHSLNNVDALSSLYSDTVSFYASMLRREKCLSIKRALLEKEGDFKQILKNELILSGYSSGAIRCDFVKTVSCNNKVVDYESYLLVKQFGRRYLIVGESDLVTDRNIKNKPDLGTRIAIKEVKGVMVKEPAAEEDKTIESSSREQIEIVVGLSFIVGIVGLLIAWGIMRKPAESKSSVHINKDVQRPVPSKRPAHIAKDLPRPPASWPSADIIPDFEIPIAPKRSEPISKDQFPHFFKKGKVFEEFIVHQFALNKGYFTLLEWRSDKFYRGVYPKSSRNPDLVYEFKSGDFVRKFSVECKYRTKAFNGLIKLMDEGNYRNYEAFNREMPVYIALGIGGKPESPAELYLIPLKDAKLEMPHHELSKYKSPGMFYYDRDDDRLI